MARMAALGVGAVTVCFAGIAALVGLGYALEGYGLVTAALLLPPLIIALVVQIFARHDRAAAPVSLYLVYAFVMGAALLSVTIGAAANTEFNPLAAVFAQLTLWRASIVLDIFTPLGTSSASRRLGFASLWSGLLTIVAIAIFVAMTVVVIEHPTVRKHLHEIAPFALAYAVASFGLLAILSVCAGALVIRIVRLLRAGTGDVRRLQWIAPALFFGCAIAVAIVVTSGYGVAKMLDAYAAFAGMTHGIAALAAPDWFTTGCVVVGIAAQLLLAYAILSRRVVDIRYYIARGTTLTILLGMIVTGVSLVEFAGERLFDVLGQGLPDSQVVLSAGAAVGLSFAAQRLHQTVEHRVQRVLFRDHYHLLSALGAFCVSIFQFDDERTLIQSASSVLLEHGRCEVVIVSLRNLGGQLRVVHGDGSGTVVPDDDPLVVELRERCAPVDAARLTSTIGSGSAFPCMLRGELFGFVLLRRCAEAQAFAPDEMAVIRNMVLHIGLAADALRAARLRSVVAEAVAGRVDGDQLRVLLSQA